MFFYDDKNPPAAVAPRGKSARATRHTLAVAATGCDACSVKASWPSLLTARMKTDGPKRADVLVLGGMPTLKDDEKGKPFQSPLGLKVRNLIPSRERERVAYQNVARCAGTEAELTRAAHACSVHLERDILEGDYKAILAVGNAAMQRLAPGTQVSDAYGLRFPVEIAGKTLWAVGLHDAWSIEKMQGMFREGQGPGPAIWNATAKRFFQTFETWPEPHITKLDPAAILYPQNKDDFWDIASEMRGAVGVDLESSRLKPYIVGARLLTGAVSDGAITMAFPIDHPDGSNTWALPALLKLVQERQWIAHNAGMELLWLAYHARRLGISSDFHAYDDTMAQVRLYFERAGCSDLGTASQLVLGTNLKNLSPVTASRIMEYPLSEILPYNGLDAQGSALIHLALINEVPAKPYKVMLDAIQSTTEMELMGLTIDPAQSTALRLRWQAEIDRTLADAHTLYEVREFEATHGRKFNIGSPDVGEALVTFGKVKLPRTPAGKQYKTDDATLSVECPDNPLARAVLDYRAATKLVSTYIDPLEAALTSNSDGLLHPSYTVLLTRTGRLSSNDPNIQNFPKRKHKELRRQIRARLGHLFYALDYGQLEARIIAMASRDRVFCKAILEGFDVHSAWLDECLKIHPVYLDHLAIETNMVGGDPKKIRKAGRDIIKTDFVFSSFFGSGSASIALRTKIPEDKVKQLQELFWNTYSDARNWIKDRRYEYETLGLSRTLTGRKRFDVLMGNEPLNNPIQGTGADIVIESMNAMAKMARDSGDMYFHPRINIHDDLIFELPEDLDHATKYLDIIMPEMVKVRHDFQIVPLMVEARVGSNWADLEEFATYTGGYNH